MNHDIRMDDSCFFCSRFQVPGSLKNPSFFVDGEKSFPKIPHVGVEPKIGDIGDFTFKMDGEKNGSNPMNKWMIWGVFPLFLVQHPCN